MSYAYYQNAAPGWGTSQFQFGPPPTLNFQPQPSWGGRDYYSAHANNSDPSLYDHAWNQVRNFNGRPGEGAVSKHEAKQWHRRAYGGLGQLSQMLPSEMGFAAAYEAYRNWIHQSSIREPLSGDYERQREGLVGLAVAEATRLLQYAGRPLDHHGRMEASDAAASTAALIFSEINDDDYVSGRRSRRSFSNSPSMVPGSVSSYDAYPYDDEGGYHRRRSHSSASRQGMLPIDGSPYAAPISIPGSSVGVPYEPYEGGSYGSYGSYGRDGSYGRGGSYGSYGGGRSYGSYGQPAMPVNMPMTMGGGPSYYGGQPNMSYGGAYGQNMMIPGQNMIPGGIPPGSTVVIQPSRHHRRSSSSSRHHHKSSHKRSRSTGPTIFSSHSSPYRY